MYIWNVMRAIGINKTERGLRVFNSSRADKSNLSEFGTIMTPPPYGNKTDTLRTCACVHVIEYEEN